MGGIRTGSSLATLQEAIPLLFDPKVGILGSVKEHDREAGAPELFRFIAIAADTRAFLGFENFAIGGGSALSRDLALAKAIGESVERYAAAIYERDDYPLYSFKDAPFACVPPEDFALYSASQFEGDDFAYAPFNEKSDVRWASARSLVSGRVRWIPACFVHLPYLFARDGDEWPLAQSISTGLACHGSFEKAAIGGICEVIERDCFSITWQAMISRPRLRLGGLPSKLQDLVGRFAKAGYAISLMDVRHDNDVPTILSVLRGQRPHTVPLAVACATDLSPWTATLKSLEELAHTERYFQQLIADLPRIDVRPNHSNVYSQISHVNFWTSPERAEHAAFLHASQDEVDFASLPDRSSRDPKRDLRQLVDQVSGTGHDVLVADLTPSDVGLLGFHVIRALIPGYHPLFMGYSVRALGGNRLWTVPRKLGYPGITRESGDNPWPHPFP